ncbi:MAG: hypothetical protein WEA29_06885 [Acidimicrobiia bacterium]
MPFKLGGVEFGLSGHGWGKYAYRLSHSYGLLGFTASQHLPAVRVQPRAELLAGLGPQAAVDAFSDVVGSVCSVDWSVSRADLYADFQGLTLSAETRNRFVTRAKTLTTYEDAGHWTGFQIGRRSGGGLSARIYEKSGQARRTGTTWWFDRWGANYRNGDPVVRVEFEFGRSVLRECSVDSPADLLRETGGLWGYGTEWLSMRAPTGDATRSRWPVAEEWEQVRLASLRDRPVTIGRVSGARRAASERRIVAGLCGYLSSFAALREIGTLDDALGSASGVLHEWELETGIPFTERVAKKRRRMEWGL